MKAFISYASEYRNIADRIAIGLRQEGVDVFFDRDQLPPGGAYDTRIRKAIKLAAKYAVEAGGES